MHGTHLYHDMGVAMVDCYYMHVWGPFELQLFIVHWVITDGALHCLQLWLSIGIFRLVHSDETTSS